MMRYLLILLAFMPSAVLAETLVAARTIRSKAILTAADLTVVDRSVPGTLEQPEQAVGMETRVVLYAGRPIRIGDVGPPAIVERNQIVTLLYRRSGLIIAAEARALGRAGAGDILRVMNLASRKTVSGTVRADGTVMVGGPDISKY